MHDNLALFVKVRSGVGVKSDAFVGGDGSQVPRDAGVHEAIVYGGRRPLLTFLRPYPVRTGTQRLLLSSEVFDGYARCNTGPGARNHTLYSPVPIEAGDFPLILLRPLFMPTMHTLGNGGV